MFRITGTALTGSHFTNITLDIAFFCHKATGRAMQQLQHASRWHLAYYSRDKGTVIASLVSSLYQSKFLL